MTTTLSNWSDRLQGTIWISMYFIANLGLTLHNKWVLSRLHFDFPWILTAIHIGVSGIGAYLLCRLCNQYRQTMGSLASSSASSLAQSKTLHAGSTNYQDQIKLLLFSVLYAINIAISNVSLSMVPLAFHQIVRSATPAFTVIIEMGLWKKYQPFWVNISLIPVMFGICLTTVEELDSMSFAWTGIVLTVLGVVLSAIKTIVTNVFLVGPLKMHPLELLWKMAPASVLQCLLYGSLAGETSRLRQYMTKQSTNLPSGLDVTTNEINPIDPIAFKLLLNGLLAFWLNWVSFTANKKTSALSMTVAGNVKQALSVILAIYVFNIKVSIWNAVGICITLAGGTMYRYAIRDEFAFGRLDTKDRLVGGQLAGLHFFCFLALHHIFT